MKRRWLVAMLVLALDGGPAAAQELRKVTFVFPVPTMQVRYAPASVAVELGYFREEGLEPNFVNLAGSSPTIQMILAGHADIATATNEFAIAARQKKLPVRYFFEWYTKNLYRVGVPESSAIKTVADLRGKKIGVLNFASAGVNYTKALMRSHGLNPETDVTFLPTGIGMQAATALRGGQVDGLAVWDTEYAGLENVGMRFRYLVHPKLANLPNGGLFSTDEWLQKNPDVAAKFGRAWAKAMTFVSANPEAAVRIHWKLYPQSKPAGLPEDQALRQALHVFRTALDNYSRDERENKAWGALSEKDWQAYIDYLVQEKVIPGPVAAAELITNQFVRAMNDFNAEQIQAKARAYQVK